MLQSSLHDLNEGKSHNFLPPPHILRRNSRLRIKGLDVGLSIPGPRLFYSIVHVIPDPDQNIPLVVPGLSGIRYSAAGFATGPVRLDLIPYPFKNKIMSLRYGGLILHIRRILFFGHSQNHRRVILGNRRSNRWSNSVPLLALQRYIDQMVS